jgi:hypothetical protein
MLLTWFSYLMLLITLQYFPARTDIAFLRIKQEEVMIFYYPPAFFIHVFSSMLVLLAGFIQFPDYIRRHCPSIHRYCGRFYVFTILLLAGPSGLIMAYHANGGWMAQLSFGILAVAWMCCTWMAFSSALKKDFNAHKKWIYRSYALTLSAISLRLFKWIIVALFHPKPMDTYIIVSWLGWTINLAICELILYRRRNTLTK